MSLLSVAPDIRSLKGRIDRFYQDSTTEAAALRKLFDEYFKDFEAVGIIGGFVRDFAFGGRSAFKSDLDLVIHGDPEQVNALAERVSAKPNRFGGYGFTTGAWKIDFWALQKTWAVTAGHVNATNLEDLINCTFFDCDAIVYEIKKQRIICDKYYLDRMRSGSIEIRLRSNPAELGNLLRAARRIIKWRLAPGPVLSQFIDDRLDDETLRIMKEEERRKYNEWFLGEYNEARRLYFDLMHVAQTVDKEEEQLTLPLFF